MVTLAVCSGQREVWEEMLDSDLEALIPRQRLLLLDTGRELQMCWGYSTKVLVFTGYQRNQECEACRLVVPVGKT